MVAAFSLRCYASQASQASICLLVVTGDRNNTTQTVSQPLNNVNARPCVGGNKHLILLKAYYKPTVKPTVKPNWPAISCRHHTSPFLQRKGGCPLVVIHRNDGLGFPPSPWIVKITTTIHHRIRWKSDLHPPSDPNIEILHRIIVKLCVSLLCRCLKILR